MTARKTLDDWLRWQEGLHLSAVDMGLARVEKVRQAMDLAPNCPVIMVAGTNGKGSTCAMLSSIFRAAGFKVGTYTSPHILRYNERIAINLQPASDERIVASFAAIDAARGETSLTYFEFGTLAAVHSFIAEKVDVIILEVGLGGRLDAVNIFEPAVSVVVSVDLDHQAILGNNREDIGFEKAGIYRAGKPAICADPNPPQRLLDHAAAIGADLKLYDRDFGFTRIDNQWSFRCGGHQRHALPIPALRGAYQMVNACAALAALDALKETLPVGIGAIKQGLVEVEWPGRFQVLPGRPAVVLDVGHNPHAVKAMLAALRQLPYAETRYAVFSMLADKDLAAVAELARGEFDHWLTAGLDMPRGQSGETIAAALRQSGLANVESFGSVADAWSAALSRAGDNDRIVVFGSFHTVAEVMEARRHPV
ncbi:bifunctional tetrahydrofolate synthase/dihydrofolate synthase [Chromobacterium subtsugae]|uniref:Dihydrofolate synthase/folylpolyglutamate synthase n=1 Tax=Chromobacterium subtsugae TaxID=251747 RepID=A0ABS7FD33_9NEIS|nr:MULTISPECIES: bifunctional tetrahydrofolate synthase/dihydrofolate synthase [Chromobacterium]KUM05101.1 bifunctional folylpolyglutamate synthase/dihydrofolate synthase [Chromobacterium subtsugae]KZE88172.1 bifunctional folylpolyglutamate synthase/dihydrofolate synthase [Chromobacterium sp. F49]MBW7565653.1 bifunctional tetrahydrofolate synthase/dihydrofolate synthase [Chromobacterium subtsugae]MBW8287984.1 bifunctional tetrahydrofolate synthase/dihydrofolate synthase [Chromobacterium subtsug